MRVHPFDTPMAKRLGSIVLDLVKLIAKHELKEDHWKHLTLPDQPELYTENVDALLASSNTVPPLIELRFASIGWPRSMIAAALPIRPRRSTTNSSRRFSAGSAVLAMRQSTRRLSSDEVEARSASATFAFVEPSHQPHQ